MSAAGSSEPTHAVANVLGSLRKKGVKLWLEDGQLRYRAAKGVLTQREIESLRACKAQLISALEGITETAEPELQPRGCSDRVPLSFSQLSRWRLLQSGEVPNVRSIASATRLRGPLNFDVLQRSITQVICRHEALRTQIVVRDGVPEQVITLSTDFHLKIDDLTAVPEEVRDVELSRLAEDFILTPVSLTRDRLFDARLLRVSNDEHVLVLAMEHMISDGFSSGILLRDILAAYEQLLNGSYLSLPALRIQFADYAVWQMSAEDSWRAKHRAYWDKRLAGCGRLRFPEDLSPQSMEKSGWGTVPFRIGRHLKRELREWCKSRGTTLPVGVFTAYAALVLRWCNASESVIQYQSDCRVTPQIENTIGFFASALCLRISPHENENLVNLLNRVTDEYCEAYEHADFSRIAAQVPRPDFTRNTVFNWIPQRSTVWSSEGSLTCCPFPLMHPTLGKLHLDHEPVIILNDASDEIIGGFYFPSNRFSVRTIERLGRNFTVFITTLLTHPEKRLRDIPLV